MQGSVQDVVFAALREAGVCPAADRLHRTIALSEGRIVAEKFFYQGGYAVWATGSGTVSFYDEDGRLRRSLALPVGASGAAA